MVFFFSFIIDVFFFSFLMVGRLSGSTCGSQLSVYKNSISNFIESGWMIKVENAAENLGVLKFCCDVDL